MSVLVVLGLGSNIGDRKEYINKAIDHLAKRFRVISISKLYETESMLKDDQQNYYNCAVLCEVNVEPEAVLSIVKQIELTIGRTVTDRWKERVIDIDILDYDRKIFKSNFLKIPHEGLHLRSFVLFPILDVVDNYLHPVYNLNTREMIENLSDDFGIKVVEDIIWRS